MNEIITIGVSKDGIINMNAALRSGLEKSGDYLWSPSGQIWVMSREAYDAIEGDCITEADWHGIPVDYYSVAEEAIRQVEYAIQMVGCAVITDDDFAKQLMEIPGYYVVPCIDYEEDEDGVRIPICWWEVFGCPEDEEEFYNSTPGDIYVLDPADLDGGEDLGWLEPYDIDTDDDSDPVCYQNWDRNYNTGFLEFDNPDITPYVSADYDDSGDEYVGTIYIGNFTRVNGIFSMGDHSSGIHDIRVLEGMVRSVIDDPDGCYIGNKGFNHNPDDPENGMFYRRITGDMPFDKDGHHATGYEFFDTTIQQWVAEYEED